MSYSLIWLDEVLKKAGLKVALVPGWETRGHGDVGVIKGVICHHTAGPKTGNMPSLKTVTEGRSDLAGPLSQLCLGRDGTFYIVSAGLCYHAGKGSWRGIGTGNTSFIGIEAENTGIVKIGDPKCDLPWPAVQMDAYQRGVAAILQHIGQSEDMCCGHKEFAPDRKIDPTFDMVDFRSAVAKLISGTAPAAILIPKADAQNRLTLRRGLTGNFVEDLQRKLGFVDAAVDGKFGGMTEAAVRQFQRDHGLVPDGIVGPKTWAAFQ